MYVMIEDTKVAFKKYGSGKRSILMVHGWGGSSASLEELGKLLSKDKKVYLLDLPGFGFSSLPKQDWGVSDYVDIVQQFIEKLQIERPIFIGHSFGGGLGMMLASLRPKLLSSLILLAPAYHREPKVSKSSRLLNKLLPVYKSIKPRLKLPRKIFYKIFYPRSDALKTMEFEEVYKRVIATDLRKYANSIKIPTLLLWGKKDQHTPEEQSHYLVKSIERIEYHSFDDFSHGFPLKYPEKIYPLIYEFISRWK